MSVAKSGMLTNSYKYFTIAVDSFENRLLKGRIFHDSLERGVSFSCLSELVLVLEGLFDQIQYPMKSVQQRNFNRKVSMTLPGRVLAESQKADSEKEGSLAVFVLQVKFRLYASWQGEITDLRDDTVFSFASFMALMEYLDRRLGEPAGENSGGLGKRVCQVSGYNDEPYIIRGDISHPSVEYPRTFINEFELKEEIEDMLPPLPEGGENIAAVPRTLQVTAGSAVSATFLVRVLFRRNETWQGTICWKEKRTKVNYRSFLEMLLLMHEAVNRIEGGKEEAPSPDEDME